MSIYKQILYTENIHTRCRSKPSYTMHLIKSCKRGVVDYNTFFRKLTVSLSKSSQSLIRCGVGSLEGTVWSSSHCRRISCSSWTTSRFELGIILFDYPAKRNVFIKFTQFILISNYHLCFLN